MSNTFKRLQLETFEFNNLKDFPIKQLLEIAYPD